MVTKNLVTLGKPEAICGEENKERKTLRTFCFLNVEELSRRFLRIHETGDGFKSRSHCWRRGEEMRGEERRREELSVDRVEQFLTQESEKGFLSIDFEKTTSSEEE